MSINNSVLHAKKTFFWEKNPSFWAFLLIALGAVVRFWIVGSGQLDLVQDEAQYWDWSRRLDLAYYSKGPLIAWVIAFSTRLAGQNTLAVRLGAMFFSVGSQVLLYLAVARYMRRPGLAVLTLFIAGTTPIFMAGGVLMTTDSPLLFFWLSALYCLFAVQCERESTPQNAQTLKKSSAAEKEKTAGKIFPWIFFTLAIAFGTLAKYTMLLVPLLAFIHAIFLKRAGKLPQGYLPKLLMSSLVGAALGLLPIVLWNMQHDWVSFRHLLGLSGLAPAKKAVPLLRPDLFLEYLGGQFGLLLPWWMCFVLLGGWRSLKGLWGWKAGRNNAGQVENLTENGTKAATSIRGLTYGPHEALLCIFFWVIWISFAFLALHSRVYPNWPGMAHASGIILGAMAFERLLYSWPPSATQRLIPLWVALSCLCFVLIYGQDIITRTVHIPQKYNPALRLKGWADLGEKLESLRLSLPNPDKVFFFSDAYDVTAELAFYLPGRPITYCADFGRRKSQYDIWGGPQGKEGWDAIYVGRKPFTYPPDQLAGMFEQLEKPETYNSKHRNAEGRSFGFIILRNFNGNWPVSVEESY